jgi:hypothetical protein
MMFIVSSERGLRAFLHTVMAEGVEVDGLGARGSDG